MQCGNRARSKTMRFLAVYLIVFTFSILFHPNVFAQSVDRALADMIQIFAPYYYNPEWGISLTQYEAWIALITLQEAGNFRYRAHSTALPGRDRFDHRNPKARNKFFFSTGLGVFQLDRCFSGADCVDKWQEWPTIKKIRPYRIVS